MVLYLEPTWDAELEIQLGDEKDHGRVHNLVSLWERALGLK